LEALSLALSGKSLIATQETADVCTFDTERSALQTHQRLNPANLGSQQSVGLHLSVEYDVPRIFGAGLRPATITHISLQNFLPYSKSF
jgi:hypothetical protein